MAKYFTLLTCLWFAAFSRADDTNVVEIHDGFIYYEVCRALGIPEGSVVTRAQMLQLTNLYVGTTPEGALSLEGLEYASNLTKFGCRVADGVSLDPLKSAPGLIALDLSGSLFRDVSPLLEFTNLFELSLSAVWVTNLNLLASHPSLRYLQRGDSQETNAEVFSVFWRLQGLFVYRNGIRDVTPFLNLTNLTALFLSGNPLTNVSLLGGMTNLTDLDLNGTGLNDCAFLTNLTHLRSLYASDNQISDLGFIRQFGDLEWLSLERNPISDISPLTSITALKYLDVAGLKLNDLVFLRGATNLEKLSMAGNRIQDLSPLTNMTKLSVLYAPENLLTNLSLLTNCPSLRNLYVPWNYLKETNYELNEGSRQVLDWIRAQGGYVTEDYQRLWGTTRLAIRPHPSGVLLQFDSSPTNLQFKIEQSLDGITWETLFPFYYKREFVVPMEEGSRFFRTSIAW